MALTLKVHELRAVLRDGRPVAVKVQRPGIRTRVIDDMEVIEELAAFVDRHTEVGRSYGFTGMVEEFRKSIMVELDYRREAANLRELGSSLTGYDRIVVPQPINDYSALTDDHGSEVARVMAGLGEKRQVWDGPRFEREIIALVQDNHGFAIGEMQAGRVVGELARIAGECGLRFPGRVNKVMDADHRHHLFHGRGPRRNLADPRQCDARPPPTSSPASAWAVMTPHRS